MPESEIEQDGKRFVVRSVPRPAASLALRATGLALHRPCAKQPPANPTRLENEVPSRHRGADCCRRSII